MELMACAGLVGGTTEQSCIFSWPYMNVSMIWNTFEMSASHLSCATAIFVIDHHTSALPQPLLLLIAAKFGLKMELMACADLVGGTTEQGCFFSELICYYKWYEIFLICLHYNSAVPQPFLLLIVVNLVLAVFFGWKWSLWSVSTWLAVQQSKYVFPCHYMLVSMIWNTS